MHAVLNSVTQLDAILDVIGKLRACLEKLDTLELTEAAIQVDLALSLVEPLHPEVVGGLHGPRPFPSRLREWVAQADQELLGAAPSQEQQDQTGG